MGKFKLGERVMVSEKYPLHSRFVGKTGTVVEEGGWAGVEFDDFIHGHDCSGAGKCGYCYRIPESDLKLISVPQFQIHISNQGLTTYTITKDGKKTVKTAKAICNPNDEFNYEYGVKLAISRLFGDSELAIDTYQPVIEVKRIAKPGEWIKVVNSDEEWDFKNKYKNGDILQAKECTGSSLFFGECDTWSSMSHDEYVVLENYQPRSEKALSDYSIDELFSEIKRRVPQQ